jgi:translation elongation factor EF-4
VHHLTLIISIIGHTDFSYEVEKALKACEGAVLLVDCTQGIQAQTMANFELAQQSKLSIIPALNKIGIDTSIS